MAPRSRLRKPPRQHSKERSRVRAADRHQSPGAGPVAGTMDQVRPQDGKRRFGIDRAPLDWPADPHQTPSGGGRAPTPDRSKTPATGLRSKGIDTGEPVTEARLIHRMSGIRWRVSPKLLILFRDWVSKPSIHAIMPSHTRHGPHYN
jgi:hypothetical protein